MFLLFDFWWHKMPRLYLYLPPISPTIQVRLTRHAGNNWRIKNSWVTFSCRLQNMDELVLADQQRHIYIRDTGCSLEDPPGAKDDRDGWWERVWELSAISITWSWYIYIYIYIKGWAEKFIWWHICCWWLFLPIGYKYCNTNGKSIRT